MPIDLTTRYDRYGRPREGALGANEMPLREGDLVADRELCLNGAGEPCEVKDPKKRTLLAAKGTIIPREVAAAVGLRVGGDGRVAWGLEPEKPAKVKK